jgi:mono/diheme cytochrome c family protein
MRKLFPTSFTAVFLILTVIVFFACNEAGQTSSSEPLTERPASSEDPVNRGKYLVTIGGCYDCHSPKIMTAQGPVLDTTRLLSGHQANTKLPPIDGKNSQWVLMAPDVTAFVGPWGISYSANLTSDSATGIGAWSETTFMQTLRTGKHLGAPNGRPILPPMPWYDIAKMTDDDLKAVYAYLQSLPPISNKVPAPVAPQDVARVTK